MSGWAQAWRIGRRELDWRFRGLRLLFVTLLLGVAALAAVGSLAAAMEQALSDRGRDILGGDVEFSRSSMRASDEEYAPFAAAGEVSQSIRMTSSAFVGKRSIPVQLKAVDGEYPLYGRLTLADGRDVGAPPEGEAYVGKALASRAPLGSEIRLGRKSFRVAGLIGDEPDRLGEGFSLGPVVMIGLSDLTATGLDQPGSLFDMRYRIATDADPDALAERVKRDFPAAGWEVKTRDNAAPGTGRFVKRMAEFLTLVVLTSLVIAGIGIANAVASFLRARQSGIATLKILGASSAMIRRVYAIQIFWVAGLAVLIGLAIGLAAVPIISRLAADLLPLPLTLSPSLGALGLAAGFGFLTALAAAAVPLTRAAHVPPAVLLRVAVDQRGRGFREAVPWLLGSGAALLALAILTATRPLLTTGFLAAVAAVIALLAGLGWVLRALAKRVPRLKNPFARLAVAGLHRPGSGTVGLVIALGAGLTMFVQIAVIQSSFDANLRRDIPTRAPGLFVLDVPRDGQEEFRNLVARENDQAEIAMVPLLRGTITGYGETDVAALEELPEGAWALRGERGLTYAETLPEGSRITDGEWWPKDYQGPPLVSVDDRLRDVLNLKLGDELRFSLYGVERAARIASFREIEWDTMGFNFVLVFSPNTLDDVPHNLAATIALGDAPVEPIRDAIAGAFPSSSQIAVGDVVEQVGEVADSVSLAIAWAAAATILAGIAVLAGTAAAMREARAYDGVMLRVLGATRRQLLRLQVMEFFLLSLIVAAVALALGSLSGWLVVTELFDMRWAPDWDEVGLTMLVGLMIILIVGLSASAASLRRRPAEALRAL